MFIMPFVKASFFNLVQIVAQSMADLRWVRAEKTAAAIDREFSAVKITDCLKTGVNTAGNPERVSPVNHHTAFASAWRALVVAYVQPVDWPFSATLRRAAGQETTS